jgi:threonine synthase
MQYYSLGQQSPPVDFKTATLLGQAPDKGLYFPGTIPLMDKKWVEAISGLTDLEIACTVIRPYVKECLPEKELQRIVAETINFEIPLVRVTENIFSLELFHGPTLAFKDIGARFMSRCLGYFVKGEQRKVTVLVATSGDTGGAVAHGFYGVEGVEVIILYPSGKVSAVQEKQLTTAGKNITAIEVSGNFDDCQQLVKQAFTDADISRQRYLTSANSINVARWLPQQFYYWFAWKQWADKSTPPVFAVPSGNFGNICAGILAWKSGLRAHHFIAACNANRTIPDFLRTLDYQPRKAIATISNAMDVGDPSNFVRVLELFSRQTGDLQKIFSSESISDAETRAAMLDLYKNHHYLADPHGAVAFIALERALNKTPGSKGIFLETAHPVKFFDVVEPVTGEPVPMPPSIEKIMAAEKKALAMGTGYQEFKDYLLATA